MHENKDRMWLKPDADVGDIISIWQYALTVDGYQYATENLGLECTVAMARLPSQTGVHDARKSAWSSLRVVVVALCIPVSCLLKQITWKNYRH